MLNLYLDQNVLGLIAEGQIILKPKVDVRWIFSNEHLTEIARGDVEEILDVLRTLKAQRLRLELDAKGRITDNRIIDEYIDPAKIYSEFRQNTPAVAPAIFQGFIAKIFGAQDPAIVEAFPDDMANQFREHLKGVPWVDDIMGSSLEHLIRKAGEDILEKLAGTQPLEKRRKPLGFDRGQASNYANAVNPLQELWEHANKQYPSPISADQFFGFDPLDKKLLGYEKWPIFLGISTCYSTLNAIGFRPDEGLARIKRVPANMSDAHHVAYAAFCDGLLSEDSRMCEKALAIYKFRQIETRVVDVSKPVGG